MKINQLFNEAITHDVLLQLMSCFGLTGLNDRKSFKKHDLVSKKTVQSIKNMKHILDQFYLPCKSKLYLENMTEKKAITVLRQVLRLFDYHIASRERNINNKKIIFYTLESDKEVEKNATQIQRNLQTTLYFN